MKTYYCVITEFYDNGTVKAAMTSRECKEQPRDTSRETAIADCYTEWFEDKAEAMKYLKDARKESAA
jgi:hypothetical protein